MAGRETYLAYRKRMAAVKLQFAEDAAEDAKKSAKEKAKEDEDYGNDKDTEKEEKKVHKSTDVDEGKGKKEFEEEDKKDKKEDKEEKELAEFSKRFAEASTDLTGRLCKLEETMGDMLEMVSAKKK